jgi:glycine/D-amino acid oxidase-like deaminating enzyme
MTTSDQKKSIVIVGGGIIGSTTAYFLTRHPSYNPSLHSIQLIEATAIAAGASGKAGGLLALWAYPQAIVPLSFRLHQELAAKHGGKERWGYRGVGVGQIELKGRTIDDNMKVLRQNGVVKPEESDANGSAEGRTEDIRGIHRFDVASDGNIDPERVSLKKRSPESYKNLRKMGMPDELDWVVENSVLGYESMGSPEDTAQVHPYLFTTSMAQLAEEKGAKIIIGSVDKIETNTSSSSDGRHTVHYSTKSSFSSSPQKHTISATDIVITAGPWTPQVWPGTPISALRAHSVTIRPSSPVSPYCLFTSLSIPRNFKSGTKSKPSHVTPEIYARPNNELYACGEGDHLVPLPATAADVQVDNLRCQDIVDYCAAFSDEMAYGEVLVRQACYLPNVDTGGGPLVGKTGVVGVYMAAGHTCWGIQNGPGTGKIMSEFVFEGEATTADVRGLDPRKVLTKGGKRGGS